MDMFSSEQWSGHSVLSVCGLAYLPAPSAKHNTSHYMLWLHHHGISICSYKHLLAHNPNSHVPPKTSRNSPTHPRTWGSFFICSNWWDFINFTVIAFSPIFLSPLQPSHIWYAPPFPMPPQTSENEICQCSGELLFKWGKFVSFYVFTSISFFQSLTSLPPSSHIWPTSSLNAPKDISKFTYLSARRGITF